MILSATKDLFTFLQFLRARKIWHETVQQSRPEAVTIEIVLPGLRAVVRFSESATEYRCFTGSEDVLDDQEQLYALIAQRDEGPELSGIGDLLPFLEFIKDRHVRFKFGYTRPEALTVELALSDILVEVDFFDDHIEYSCFMRDESVEDDQQKLFDMIEERLS